MNNHTQASQPDDSTQSPENATRSPDFGRCVESYEAQARALSRGFKTALFIQQFKSGLLGIDERKRFRLH